MAHVPASSGVVSIGGLRPVHPGPPRSGVVGVNVARALHAFEDPVVTGTTGTCGPRPDTVARLAAMRVRRFELRVLAAVLTAGWAAAAGLVLAGYRPGGPIDLLVGVAALPAVAIAAAALVWPPVARGDRAFATIAWIGIGAALVLAPSVGGLVEQLEARGPQTLLPSVETAYPWLLALLGTAFFTGLGVTRRLLGETALRRRRLFAGATLALVLTTAAAVSFASVAIANDLALRDQPASASRFGPTDPSLEPPECDGPLAAGRTARLALSITGEVDGRGIGDGQLTGVRDGSDFRWAAAIASTVRLGRDGQARIEERAWVIGSSGSWVRTSLEWVADGAVDLQVLSTALTAGNRVTAESRGIGFIEGARARHCRIAIDGPTFEAAFPQVRWVVADADISRWRGDLDYWVFADGELGQVVADVNGEGADLRPKGIQGTVRVTMTATDRGAPHPVVPPAT